MNEEETTDEVTENTKLLVFSLRAFCRSTNREQFHYGFVLIPTVHNISLRSTFGQKTTERQKGQRTRIVTVRANENFKLKTGRILP